MHLLVVGHLWSKVHGQRILIVNVPSLLPEGQTRALQEIVAEILFGLFAFKPFLNPNFKSVASPSSNSSGSVSAEL